MSNTKKYMRLNCFCCKKPRNVFDTPDFQKTFCSSGCTSSKICVNCLKCLSHCQCSRPKNFRNTYYLAWVAKNSEGRK